MKDGLSLWMDATRQFQAWAAHDRTLIAQEPFDVFYDASGNHRDLTQPVKEFQPQIIGSEKIAAVRLDGEDDFLRWSGDDVSLKEATVFIVASTRSNKGGFRAFIAASENGKSDYTSGFTIDLGPPASDGGFGLMQLNVEGKGFGGAGNLLKGLFPLEEINRFTASIASGKGNVRAYANGEPTGQRDRAGGGAFKINNFTIGARLVSTDDAPPHVRGFLHADVAEIIVYDRVLTDDERKAVDSYLAKKYEAGADALNRSVARGTPLVPVKNPPAVQMFMPGFVTRTLPVDLTNINNLRYRPDGKLMALAYDGNVYLLSDTDGDGLEDKVETFWKNEEQIVAPIGMALTPPGYSRGDGLFIACKGKLSLIVDTDNDDVADKEIVVAEGWPPSISPVDALGVAVAEDQSVYFGLVCANFLSAYLPDKDGNAQYSLTSERGTIVKVSPDFSKREIVCTGIRVPVGLAFNKQGDLFCTDQEGATWLPNGNPYDELLHITPGRHYGFPPRHPKLLPDVVDEPSTFDY
ncbi:MAG: hypothetical protein H0T11_01260, partial [Chthoniobacterales bacterium]|nr:hypothetical protein [Chthoniobacterales bacterium]